MAIVPTPADFELTDPGTGGRLIASISNRTDYGKGTDLIISDLSGTVVATGDASTGLVNIFGLNNGVAQTFRAQARCDTDLSAFSGSDTETPTDTNAAVTLGNTTIFARVQVRFSPVGGSIIRWCVRNTESLVKPFTFTVQFSNAPDLQGDHWEDVATVIDDTLIIDPESRIFSSVDILAYYRVVLLDGAGTEIISEAVQAIGEASRHDFLIARAIVRREFLRLSKFAGVRGLLHKRKVFGDECTQCLDQDTGAIIDPECPDCFATGIIGGYHKAIEFFIELGLKGRRITTDVNFGQVENITLQCRCLGCPELNEGDLWIREDTGERYFIREVRDAAHLVVPVVVVANLRKVPFDDPAYKVPSVA